jgi:hypothetical protein
MTKRTCGWRAALAIFSKALKLTEPILRPGVDFPYSILDISGGGVTFAGAQMAGSS